MSPMALATFKDLCLDARDPVLLGVGFTLLNEWAKEAETTGN